MDVQRSALALALLNEVWITFTLRAQSNPKASQAPASHAGLSPEMSNIVT